jgi:hypothetical protein
MPSRNGFRLRIIKYNIVKLKTIENARLTKNIRI